MEMLSTFEVRTIVPSKHCGENCPAIGYGEDQESFERHRRLMPDGSPSIWFHQNRHNGPDVWVQLAPSYSEVVSMKPMAQRHDEP
jgi:hypothetical protein